MKIFKAITILMAVLMIIIPIIIVEVEAAQETLMGFQTWIYNNDGTPFDSGTVLVNVSDSSSCNGNINSTEYVDQTTDQGILDVMLTMNMSYNNDYWICLFVEGEQVIGPSNFRGLGEIGAEDVGFSVGGNPFDQSLNTTDNVTHDYLNVTNYLTIGGSGGIQIRDDRIYFDGGTVPFDDVYISEGGNVLNFFARHDTNKDKWLQWFLNPTTGMIVSFGADTNPVLYSETQGAILGTDTYPWIIKSKNITNDDDIWCNSTNCYSLAELLGGAGGNPFDQELNTTEDVIFNSVTDNKTTIINHGLTGAVADVALLVDTKTSGAFAIGQNGATIRHVNGAGFSSTSYPLYVEGSNIGSYGTYIKTNSSKDAVTYGIRVAHESFDDDKNTFGSYFYGKGNGSAYGFQGYGYSTATNVDDFTAGIYGFTAGTANGKSPQYGLLSAPGVLGGNFTKDYGIYSGEQGSSGSGFFRKAILYITNSSYKPTDDIFLNTTGPATHFTHIADNAGSVWINKFLEVVDNAWFLKDVDINGDLDVGGNITVNSELGLTGNFTNGNCWTAYMGGIAYATNCTAY